MNKKFKDDYYRMTGEKWNGVKGCLLMLLRYDIRYLYLSSKKKDESAYTVCA